MNYSKQPIRLPKTSAESNYSQNLLNRIGPLSVRRLITLMSVLTASDITADIRRIFAALNVGVNVARTRFQFDPKSRQTKFNLFVMGSIIVPMSCKQWSSCNQPRPKYSQFLAILTGDLHNLLAVRLYT